MTRALIAVAFLFAAAVASAQDTRGASVSVTASAANMQSHTDASFAAAFGYRFTDVVGLELEATVVPTLKTPYPGATIQNTIAESLRGEAGVLGGLFLGPTFTNPGGRAVILSNNVRVHIPTTSVRLTPYFVSGGGVGHIRRTADFNIPAATFTVVNGLPAPVRFTTTTQRMSASALELALTIGGGLGVRVAPRLWVDADLRMFRLMGDEDQNLGRFGVAARYGF
jgi:hypothetical protein